MSRLIRLLLPFVAIFILMSAVPLRAQEREPGHPIGKVSVLGKLIVLELNKGALGHQNLFDLNQHTLRFTPSRAGLFSFRMIGDTRMRVPAGKFDGGRCPKLDSSRAWGAR